MISSLLKLSDEELQKQCHWENFTGKGPGGQHRNRVKTGVRIHHKSYPDIQAYGVEHREGGRNLKSALLNLRWELALSGTNAGITLEEFMEDYAPIATPKQLMNESNPRFVLFAHYSLYFLQKFEGRAKDCAEKMGWKTSPWIKQAFKSRRLWQKLLELRRNWELPPLKAPK